MSPVTSYDACIQLIHNYKPSWWTYFNLESLYTNVQTIGINALCLTSLRDVINMFECSVYVSLIFIPVIFANVYSKTLERDKWRCEDGSENWAGFHGTGGFYEIVRQVRKRLLNTLVAHLFVWSQLNIYPTPDWKPGKNNLVELMYDINLLYSYQRQHKITKLCYTKLHCTNTFSAWLTLSCSGCASCNQGALLCCYGC